MTGTVYTSVFATATDPYIKFALAGSFTIFILSFLFIFQILIIGTIRRLDEKKRRQLANQWRPVFSCLIEGVPQELPSLKKKNIIDFLILWNHYHSFLKGKARDNLNILLRRLRLDKDAIRLLRGNNLRKKFIAITTVGNLKDSYVWNDLNHFLSHPNNRLSLAAAEAMIQIRPPEAVRAISRLISERDDWPDSRIVTILKKTEAHIFSPPLAEAALQAHDSTKPRLIRLASITRHETIKEIVNRCLIKSAHENIIAACLHILNDPEKIKEVRQLSHHPSGDVRINAARALGRIGEKEDINILVALLSDKEWWVRYHAAKALVSLPFLTHDEVKEISANHKDRYGRDMLNRMIAKEGMEKCR